MRDEEARLRIRDDWSTAPVRVVIGSGDHHVGKESMDKLYKVTNNDGCTRDYTRWGPGVTHGARDVTFEKLCSPGYIHAYEHPLLAVLLSPLNCQYRENYRMWEAEGVVELRDGQLKCGCRSLTTIREIPVPDITVRQHIRFAIACVWPFADDEFKAWATVWLNRKDPAVETPEEHALFIHRYGVYEDGECSPENSPESYVLHAALMAQQDNVVNRPGTVLYFNAQIADAIEVFTECEHNDGGNEEDILVVDLGKCAEWAMTDSKEVPTLLRKKW